MRFAGSDSSDNGRSQRKTLQNELSKEQKLLEEMVLETLKNGSSNLGKNTKILKQSGKLDKLIVDEMMLRDMERKYPKK